MEAASALLVFITRLKLVRRQFVKIASAMSKQRRCRLFCLRVSVNSRTAEASAVLLKRKQEQSTTTGSVGCSICVPTLTADAAR